PLAGGEGRCPGENRVVVRIDLAGRGLDIGVRLLELDRERTAGDIGKLPGIPDMRLAIRAERRFAAEIEGLGMARSVEQPGVGLADLPRAESGVGVAQAGDQL